MKYKLLFQKRATTDLSKLRKYQPEAWRKLTTLLIDLEEHPETGTGRPEKLKGFDGNVWSRRITPKHRLVYVIKAAEVIVIIISAYGHYDDK